MWQIIFYMMLSCPQWDCLLRQDHHPRELPGRAKDPLTPTPLSALYLAGWKRPEWCCPWSKRSNVLADPCSGPPPLRRKPLILGAALVWGRAGAGRGCIPGCLGESPGALTWFTPCGLPFASFLFLPLDHTSSHGALGPCQTLSCHRVFAHAISSAQKALLSHVLPPFL